MVFLLMKSGCCKIFDCAVAKTVCATSQGPPDSSNDSSQAQMAKLLEHIYRANINILNQVKERKSRCCINLLSVNPILSSMSHAPVSVIKGC